MILLAVFLGSLAQWLTIIALVGVGYFVVKGSGGQALAILQQSNKVLARRVGELERQHHEDVAAIGKLEERTNLEPIVGAVVEQFEAQRVRATERHAQLLELAASAEQRAQERHEALLGAYATLGHALTQGIERVTNGEGS